MTISYSDSMSLLVLRWKGSVYKAVLKDLLVFYFLYYVVFFIQKWILDERDKSRMHGLIVWFEKGTSYIPITFLLGFYVAGVLARWWQQFNWISWPDRFMIICNMTLSGRENLKIRHTLARWSNLQGALAWRLISERTIKRFPTERHLVDSGLMTEIELNMYQSLDAPYGKWFLPVMWMANLVRKCHQDKTISSVQLKMLNKVLLEYRDGFEKLFFYDWVKIPLVYTQVVAIATYGYFALCLIARQPFFDEESKSKGITLHFPIFTTLQLVFYMGWLKVGQYLASPFGEDDDDFELNYILDRNNHVSQMIVNQCHDHLPKVDVHFDDKQRFIPHTKASASKLDNPPKDPFSNYTLSEELMETVQPEDAMLKKEEKVNRFKSLRRNVFKRARSKQQLFQSVDIPEEEKEELENNVDETTKKNMEANPLGLLKISEEKLV